MWLDGKRSAVEHDLVLSADLVDIEQRQAVAPAGLSEDSVAQLALAHVRRAGVDRHHQIGRRIAHALKGVDLVVLPAVVPAVFADHEADARLPHAQHRGHVGARLEVATLVEDVVGGQQLLGVAEHHLAAFEHQQGIAQVLARSVVRYRRPHHPHQLTQLARGLAQRLQARSGALQEGRVVEQIARVVAGERQFREHHHLGAIGPGLLRRADHLRDVAADVAHGVVQLGHGELEHHAPLFSALTSFLTLNT